MAEVMEQQRCFTLEEYHRMGETGVIAPSERVELIRGVVREMSPKGRGHRVAVAIATHLFVTRLDGRACVQVQDPVPMEALQSEPEPDIAIFSSADPRELGTERSRLLLVIEVADTSLRADRKIKIPLYAEAGVPEYWILDLGQGRLEAHREPGEGQYRQRLVLEAADPVAPLSFPDLEIQVRDLLP